MSNSFATFTLKVLIKQMENTGDVPLLKRKIKTRFGSLTTCGTGFLETLTLPGLTLQTTLIASRNTWLRIIGGGTLQFLVLRQSLFWLLAICF